MIKSVTITNYLGSLDEHIQRSLGITKYEYNNNTIHIKLNDPEPSHGWLIKNISGLGPAGASINMTELATTDGARYNSSKLGSRNVVLTIGFDNCDDAEEARELSYKFLPIKRKVMLSIETNNRNARVIGYVESNEPDIFSKAVQSNVSIICPDPYFYSNEYGFSPHIIQFAGLDSEFYFEDWDHEGDTVVAAASYETELGVMTGIVSKSFVYSGDQETGVEMTIHFLGTVGDDILIYQTKNSENPNEPEIQVYFRLVIEQFNALMDGLGLNHDFLAGDDIVINTSLGNKRINLVRNAVTYNILNAVDRASDWFQLGKGPNTFWLSTSNPSLLDFTLKNYVIYEGI
jgi:hypothetical protein